jgi:hypothetical protein
MQDRLAIVLTGTIVPNSIMTAHIDPQVRRQEYLDAIHFYTKFAPVYFLENSTYPVEEDIDFNSIPNLFIRKMPLSLFCHMGKGYQEFEMIDRWLEQEKNLPSKWFKISGRYIFKNFSSIIDECLNDEKHSLVMDRMLRHNIAFTDILCIKTEFYINHFKGIYKSCEDISGKYIEKILYNNLMKNEDKLLRVFIHVPRICVISGTTGLVKEDTNIVYYTKVLLRRINILLSLEYLLYPFMKMR